MSVLLYRHREYPIIICIIIIIMSIGQTLVNDFQCTGVCVCARVYVVKLASKN